MLTATALDLKLFTDPRLHDYQCRAVKHLWTHDQAALFYPMGAGKSAVVLNALGAEYFPALVIGPKRVVEIAWPEQVKQWRPELSFAVAAGTPAQRHSVLDSDYDVTAIGVSNIKDVPLTKFKTIILDELSLWKSRQSQRWKLTRRLTKTAKYVWGLTGTPTPNGLMDLWAQVFLLDGGERLDMAITRFRERYFVPVSRLPGTHIVTQWRLRPRAQEEIQDKISDICLSMRASDYLTLPDMTVNEVHIAMPPRAKQAYEEMRKDLTTHEVLAANAAVASGKLSQITAGFLYPDETGSEITQLHTEKIDAVEEIVNGTGSPVLVFYRFREELTRLLDRFPEAVQVTDKGAVDDWNSGRVPVLLAHPASAGHGINLQAGGHTIVWSSLPWSSELWEQGNARLARQGQGHPVTVHVVTAPGTIDVRIAQALRDKVSLQDAVLEALMG